MKTVRRGLFILVTLAVGPLWLMKEAGGWRWLIWLFCGVLFLLLNIWPVSKATAPTRRIRHLAAGCELLRLFLATATLAAAMQAVFLWKMLSLLTPEDGYGNGVVVVICILSALSAVAVEAIVFWNGMIRVYLTSVQLGLKHRILAALCGWIPLLNIWYLGRIIRIASDEAEFETEKWELDEIRAESEICKTRYPILLVHGVFFRDFRYLNYWGRIPRELKRNGAQVFYGRQQSAAAVEDSGRELARRIQEILAETGCEKVNIIAHSKAAGQPCRYRPRRDAHPSWPHSPPSTPPTGAVFLLNTCWERSRRPPGKRPLPPITPPSGAWETRIRTFWRRWGI